MKAHLLPLIAAALLTTPSVNAMRLKHGTVLITEGDPITKLQSVAGKATRRDNMKVCRRPSPGACRGGYRQGTRYQYVMKDRTWFVDAYKGVITHIEWTR